MTEFLNELSENQINYLKQQKKHKCIVGISRILILFSFLFLWEFTANVGIMPYGERVVRRIRKTKSSLKQLLIPGMIFENMGITYLGPVDGHNLMDLVRILREAKKVNGAVSLVCISRIAQRYIIIKL